MSYDSPEALPQLTPAELEVMKALWRSDRLSARELHDRVAPRHGWAYSTTRTTVERMVRKGLVGKVAVHGLAVYEPRISRAAGLARLVRDVVEVLGAEPAPVLALLDRSDSLTEAEIAELRGLLGGAPERRR